MKDRRVYSLSRDGEGGHKEMVSESEYDVCILYSYMKTGE
jgi:hypothetical protein